MKNLVEILRNAPRGLKLYSPIYGEVTLSDVQPYGIYVKCESVTPNEIMFDEYGRRTEKGECVLFPSKECKNWDNWQYTLFKPGHFITAMGLTFCIQSKLNCEFKVIRTNGEVGKINPITAFSFAPTGKIEQFYADLERNGYKLTNGKLEKIKDNKADALLKEFFEGVKTKLVDSKPFTIDDFKPFDKVLVRDCYDPWSIQIFSHYTVKSQIMYHVIGDYYNKCVPYNDETKYLLGTKQEYNGKYKTW